MTSLSPATILADGWYRVDYPNADVDGAIADVRLVQGDKVLTRRDGGIPVESVLRWGWKFSPVHVLTDDDLRQLEQAAASVESRREAGMLKELHEVEQILGKVLNYPWYKDDQVNFPGTTEADGVCTGEHTAGTLAMEAARRIEQAVVSVDANGLKPCPFCGGSADVTDNFSEYAIMQAHASHRREGG